MSGIPDPIARFISERINSIEQLEVLLLLAREPARPWTADKVSLELRSSPDAALKRLDDLLAQGLLERSSDQYRFAPADDATQQIVTELDEIYRDHRYSVIDLIYPSRGDPLRDFADAFRIRKKEDGDG